MLNYLQQKVGERGWMRKSHILQLKDYAAFGPQPSPRLAAPPATATGLDALP